MKKKLSELTKEDICETCEKYSNNFTGECPTVCPFYMSEMWGYQENYKRTETHCKTNHHYIKHHPNEEVKF